MTAMAVLAPLFGRVPLEKIHAQTARVAVVPPSAPTSAYNNSVYRFSTAQFSIHSGNTSALIELLTKQNA